MNGSVMAMGVMAASSIALAGFLAYRLRIFSRGPERADAYPLQDNSSLEEDFQDILGFLPLPEVREIIEKYMRYDAQIGETVSFINDQKRFILREFQRMPQMIRLLDFLRGNGLEVDQWGERIRVLWKTAPRFARPEPAVANGGLTVMIDKIVKSVPQDELREMLRQKTKYSASFRKFLLLLRSEEFRELCDAIERNDVLHHHFFWAKESGIEITFALELFRNFYIYLTEEIL